MTKKEAVAAVAELSALIFADVRGPVLRAVNRASADRAQAEALCTALESAPCPPGLLREKLGPIRRSLQVFFERRGTINFDEPMHDLTSLRLIVQRAKDEA